MGEQGKRPKQVKVGSTIEINTWGGKDGEPLNEGDWGVVERIDGTRAIYTSNEDGEVRVEKLACCYVLDVSKEEIEANTRAAQERHENVEEWQRYNRFRNQLWGEAAIKHFRWCPKCRTNVGPFISPNFALRPRKTCAVCNATTKKLSKAQMERLQKPQPTADSIFPEYARLDIVQPQGRRTC